MFEPIRLSTTLPATESNQAVVVTEEEAIEEVEDAFVGVPSGDKVRALSLSPLQPEEYHNSIDVVAAELYPLVSKLLQHGPSTEPEACGDTTTTNNCNNINNAVGSASFSFGEDDNRFQKSTTKGASTGVAGVGSWAPVGPSWSKGLHLPSSLAAAVAIRKQQQFNLHNRTTATPTTRSVSAPSSSTTENEDDQSLSSSCSSSLSSSDSSSASSASSLSLFTLSKKPTELVVDISTKDTCPKKVRNHTRDSSWDHTSMSSLSSSNSSLPTTDDESSSEGSKENEPRNAKKSNLLPMSQPQSQQPQAMETQEQSPQEEEQPQPHLPGSWMVQDPWASDETPPPNKNCTDTLLGQLPPTTTTTTTPAVSNPSSAKSPTPNNINTNHNENNHNQHPTNWMTRSLSMVWKKNKSEAPATTSSPSSSSVVCVGGVAKSPPRDSSATSDNHQQQQDQVLMVADKQRMRSGSEEEQPEHQENKPEGPTKSMVSSPFSLLSKWPMSSLNTNKAVNDKPASPVTTTMAVQPIQSFDEDDGQHTHTTVTSHSEQSESNHGVGGGNVVEEMSTHNSTIPPRTKPLIQLKSALKSALKKTVQEPENGNARSQPTRRRPFSKLVHKNNRQTKDSRNATTEEGGKEASAAANNGQDPQDPLGLRQQWHARVRDKFSRNADATNGGDVVFCCTEEDVSPFESKMKLHVSSNDLTGGASSASSSSSSHNSPDNAPCPRPPHDERFVIDAHEENEVVVDDDDEEEEEEDANLYSCVRFRSMNEWEYIDGPGILTPEEWEACFYDKFDIKRFHEDSMRAGMSIFLQAKNKTVAGGSGPTSNRVAAWWNHTVQNNSNNKATTSVGHREVADGLIQAYTTCTGAVSEPTMTNTIALVDLATLTRLYQQQAELPGLERFVLRSVRGEAPELCRFVLDHVQYSLQRAGTGQSAHNKNKVLVEQSTTLAHVSQCISRPSRILAHAMAKAQAAALKKSGYY
ncbi:hypothetical protein ACA910_010935 [Epithemia clementina (nom. ined.)]